MVEEIEAEKLKNWLDKNTPCTLIDVREIREFQSEHIEGSINYPLSDWESLLEIADELSEKHPIIMVCKVGARSFQAAHRIALQENIKIYNLKGGLTSWYDHNR